MNSNNNVFGKTRVLLLAIIQIAASCLMALSAKTGFLYVGSLLIGIAGSAFALQILVSGGYWYFISAAVSMSLSLVIGGVFPCIMSAFAIPAGIITAYLIKKKSPKMTVTVALDFIYAIAFALLFLFGYLYEGYEFSAEAIIKYYSEIIDYIKQAVINDLGSEDIALLMERWKLTESQLFELIDSLVEEIKLILPAVLVASMGVIAYVGASFFKIGAAIAKCEILLPEPRWKTLPSKASAVVFSISYVLFSLTMMFSSAINVVYLVSYSVVIILSPVMMLMGIKRVRTMKNRGFVIALFVFGVMIMAPLAAVILSFLGVNEIFAGHRKIKKENSDTHNQ